MIDKEVNLLIMKLEAMFFSRVQKKKAFTINEKEKEVVYELSMFDKKSEQQLDFELTFLIQSNLGEKEDYALEEECWIKKINYHFNFGELQNEMCKLSSNFKINRMIEDINNGNYIDIENDQQLELLLKYLDEIYEEIYLLKALHY